MSNKSSRQILGDRVSGIFQAVYKIQVSLKPLIFRMDWDSEITNAYFFSGRDLDTIIFHDGFFKFVNPNSDDEIACIIGHEMAHAIHGVSDGDEELRVEIEKKCDRLGVLYAALAGYDPKAHYKVFDRAYSTDGVGVTISQDHEFRKIRSDLARKNGLWADHFRVAGETNKSHRIILGLYLDGKLTNE